MNIAEFKYHFGQPIRVSLNWQLLSESNASIKLQQLQLPGDAGRIFTPWYLDGSGAACNYFDQGAVPQNVSSAAQSEALKKRHGFHYQHGAPTVVVAPAYGLPDGGVLLLDGNHRVVSAYLGGVNLLLMAFVIEGPLDAQILPDLEYWA
nr:hypothetical protein [Dyella sp. ASV24]